MPESLTDETVESEPLPQPEESEELAECPDCGNDDARQCQCADCEQCAALCRCTNCEECEESCDCVTCGNCGDRVSEYACSDCQYCDRCIQNGRVDHYSCGGCGECFNPDQTNCCGECGRAECCRDFSGNCENGHCTRCCANGCECEADEETCNHIHSYSCRRYPPASPPVDSVPPTFLYVGVELETECPEGVSRRDASLAIYEHYSHRILQKEDGSLNNGIEFVTGKLSLEEHKKLWPTVCETAVQAGLRSWKHKTTGLHVHLSRSHFSSLDIGKLVCFINSSDLAIRANLRKLAGRASTGYSEIKHKKIGCAHRSCETRYEAVNLTNDATVEIRIFKGTLNPSRILADIEFCHALAGYVKHISIAELESWPNFLAFTKSQGKPYKNFLQFMAPHAPEFSDNPQPTTPNPTEE